MRWAVLLVPLNLFGGWNSDWDALEDYVNGVTTAPPQFITTNVVHDLQQAMLERALSLNVTDSQITNLIEISRFNAHETTSFPNAAFKQIDLFIDRHGPDFAPASWISGGQPSSEMLEYCQFYDNASYDADAFTVCDDPVGVNTIAAWTSPTRGDAGKPSFMHGGAGSLKSSLTISKWWTGAEGYPDELALWRFEVTNTVLNIMEIDEHWSFLENPTFPGGLLGECIYTVTNVYTSGDDVHYQVGWKFTEHDAFDKLFRTNDWTGSDALVRASLSVPTGTHPNVEFTVQGYALNTGDWFTYENQTESTRETYRRHMSPTTNTFTVGGAGETTYAQPVFMDLFTDGIACANTVDTTNIASVAHLGASLSLEWYGTRASYSPHALTGYTASSRGSRFANVYALVGRKWALQAMELAFHPTTALSATKTSYAGESDFDGTYADATGDYAETGTTTRSSLFFWHNIAGTYRCSGGQYFVDGSTLPVAVAVTNLYDGLSVSAVYCIATDNTGPTHGVGTFITWQNGTPNASQGAYYTIATSGGGGADNYAFNIDPGAVGFPSTPGAGDGSNQTGGFSDYAYRSRGFSGEIVDHMLVDWDYEYE